MPQHQSNKFHLPFYFRFGSSNLFSPAKPEFGLHFGHWQPAILSPDDIICILCYSLLKVENCIMFVMSTSMA